MATVTLSTLDAWLNLICVNVENFRGSKFHIRGLTTNYCSTEYEWIQSNHILVMSTYPGQGPSLNASLQINRRVPIMHFTSYFQLTRLGKISATICKNITKWRFATLQNYIISRIIFRQYEGGI